MKHFRLLTRGLLALLSLIILNNSFAQQSVRITASALNVRTGPGTDHNNFGLVYSGQKYVSIARNGSWHLIDFDERKGWVHGSYLTNDSAGNVRTNVTNYLNVRTGPGTGYRDIGDAKRDQRWVVIDASGEWRKVNYRGGGYWMHGAYLASDNNPTPPPPPPPPASNTRVFNVTIKTYIARVGLSYGSLPIPILTPPTTRAAAYAKLVALAAVTDVQFNENPTNTAVDKGYRIYSNLNITATCTNNRLSTTHRLTSDTGKEGPLQAPPAIGLADYKQTNLQTWAFKWYLRAKPHPVAEPAFLAVWPRTNPYIWQKMEGFVSCENNNPRLVTNLFDGSKFPSHRYWIDAVEKHTKDQQGMAELWKLDRPSL